MPYLRRTAPAPVRRAAASFNVGENEHNVGENDHSLRGTGIADSRSR
jgi:hypothetical protein